MTSQLQMITALLFLLFCTIHVAHGQDIVPGPNAENDEGAVFIDTSNLGKGTSFYEAETLGIQLFERSPTWTLRNTRETTAYFAGESDDRGLYLSLMRYTSPQTGLEALTGILHDRSENLFYEIRPDYEGRDTVRSTLEDDLPPLGDPLEPSFWERMTTFDSANSVLDTWKQNIQNAIGYNNQISRMNHDIAVMVIWTESTECYQSGLSTDCARSATTQTNMEAAVTLMIEETNTAMRNSATESYLVLVHAQVDSDGYRETRMRDTLSQITNLDFVMDYIHRLRDEKRADLVQFIVDNRLDADKLGGVAWLPQKNAFGCWNSGLGYSVICAQCMMNYISAHEFGHNLNCLHDRGTQNSCAGFPRIACNTNFGYRSPESNFRSIMSYQCTAGQCDNNLGNPCPRIPYYSGEFEYNGESVGGTESNCAQEIRNMYRHIHNYR